MRKKYLLGEFLLRQGLITPEQLKRALRYQKETGKLLGNCLVDLGYVNEKDIIKALSEQMGVQYVSLKNYRVDPETIKLVPENIARTHKLLPLFKVGKTLTVGMANPLDVMAIDAVSRRTNLQVDPVVCSEADIERMIDHYYGSSGALGAVVKSLQETITEKEEAEEKLDEIKLRREAEEGPVVKLVNLILLKAIKEGASDIHIEPREHNLRVRYRIDGVLHEVYSPPKALQSALISRIKILSELNIAERRLPQDGRFRMEVENREVDFRVSILPTAYGENLVIRILDKGQMVLSLEDLGLAEATLAKFKKVLTKPHGIILVTGPTGSGKTTTLYAVLTTLDSPEKNIVTLEDPIEYHLDTICQSQVRPKIGLTFATGLRSILRQDPDIVMVGEIRDQETAGIAVQSALTGHLVLSTLHTNDAAGALTRLMDMGVEPYLISSATEGVVAQRLVRRICPTCKEAYKPSAKLLTELGINGDHQNMTLYRGKGCRNCKNTGYKGRIGIYELLIMDEQVRELVFSRAPTRQIKKVAMEKGMNTLWQDGIRKALQGITSIEEVLRVTH